MSRRLLLALLALLIPALPVPAWPQIHPQSQTPAAKVLSEWLTTFNSGDPVRLLAFWKKYSTGPQDSQVSRDQGLHDMTGGFTLIKITEDTGSHIVASMKDRHDGYAEVTLDLASTDPPIIRGIFGHPAPPPPSERDPASSDSDLVRQVTTHVADLLHKDQFSGAILIAKQGQPILNQAWGFADRARKIPNTVDTRFCLGSMNKMFTAVAVLQLVQQGKLSLDGTLADYWPSYPNHDLATHVKVRQLLNHTAGTGDIFTPEYEAHRLQTRTLDDYAKLFGSRPVAFEPGSKYEYSNYGYILLGRLVEIASGEDYQTYVQQHIYALAGMTHTDSRPETEAIPRHAIGYMRGAGGLRPNTSTQPWSGTSAGGGYSTTGDLLLFANALKSGKLLATELLKQATTPQSASSYGFGFYALEGGGYGHGGGAPGVNAEMHILPSGYVVIVLENLDPPAATAMANFIEARLPLVRR